MEQPEGGRWHSLVEPADITNEAVGSEKGEIVEADDGGVDRLGRDFSKERETDRQEMREGDAVEEVERDRPEEPDLLSRALRRGGGEG